MMNHNAINLLLTLEIQEEEKELRVLGLSEEEIQGYLDFFIENYPFVVTTDK